VIPFGFKAAEWFSPGPEPVDLIQAEAGKELFFHQWKKNDLLTPDGDGVGPVFNANSCMTCHSQGGPGGAGGNEFNVVNFVMPSITERNTTTQGVIHTNAVSDSYREFLNHLDPLLPKTSRLEESFLRQSMGNCRTDNPRLQVFERIDISERNTPAIFGVKLIDDIPESAIIANARKQRLKWGFTSAESESIPVGRVSRTADGRIGRFGWKGQVASLSDFVEAACANELGLENPGSAQPTSLADSSYQTPGLDLTQEQCDQITQYCASLPRPQQVVPESEIEKNEQKLGREVFTNIGCANCHTPNIGNVKGLYSDLLLHRMGQKLIGGGSYGEPILKIANLEDNDGVKSDEWKTPPLWGVADSAPYLHDGRASSLHQAILLHGGQAEDASKKFNQLKPETRKALISFLSSLKAPPETE